ncbi:type II toxin-antitoxin system HipA family toxin [Thiolapillus sp.]|uniref:type II toxin-antitoxin system HipA family toxin n=1 Tax=Thiolapillus sp. TaxID=2017437 RepID=UPI003AF9933F
MKDLQGVVWTRIGGEPCKMGDLAVTDREARFTYTPSFAESGLPGLGVLYPVSLFGDTTVPFLRRQGFSLHPPLQSLVPAAGDSNFQRQLALRWLESQGMTIPEKGLLQDWLVLTRTGHGGIGHLDVFVDDRIAEDWYTDVQEHSLYTIDRDFGFSLKSFLSWYDQRSAACLSIIGPTPTVGGAIPKLPLSIPAEGWNGQIGLPTRRSTPGITDVILKMEKDTAYPGLVELEALALDLHREAGFDTPRYWLAEIGEVPVIAVERFDRDVNNAPRVNETLLSVLATAKKDITRRDGADYEHIASLIQLARFPLFADKKQAARHLLKRLLLALFSGNGDLHLENLSLTGEPAAYRFSPVYDPTPMRAYSIHNMLAPMSFGGYGDLDENGNPVHLRLALERFTASLGLRITTLDRLLQELRPVVESLPDRINGLSRLPAEHKDRLVRVVTMTLDAAQQG